MTIFYILGSLVGAALLAVLRLKLQSEKKACEKGQTEEDVLRSCLCNTAKKYLITFLTRQKN